MMNQDGFIPFSMGDLCSENAPREERYYKVVDAVVNLLLSDDSYKERVKEVDRTFCWDGYSRRIRFYNYIISIHYSRSAWKSKHSIETPFWFEIEINQDDIHLVESVPDFVFDRYPDLWKEVRGDNIWLALFTPTNVGINEVASTIEKQIINYELSLNDEISCYEVEASIAMAESEEEYENRKAEEEPPREIDIGDEFGFEGWQNDGLGSIWRDLRLDRENGFDSDNPTESDYLKY